MVRPKVYVTRMIPKAGIDLLRETGDVETNPEDRPLTRQELLQDVRGRQGVIGFLTDRIDAEFFEAAAGVNNPGREERLFRPK